MTKTENHTPTPWTIGERDTSDNSVLIRGAGTRGNYVASVSPRPHYADNQDANAEIIVRAVNSHAALVEALEAAKDELADQHDRQVSIGDEPNIAESLFEQIDAALQLAKGA